ncbi:MAG: hypothetical protein ACJAX5_001253 [Patiriisocius sp.]|jgi:hypothetical protein
MKDKWDLVRSFSHSSDDLSVFGAESGAGRVAFCYYARRTGNSLYKSQTKKNKWSIKER